MHPSLHRSFRRSFLRAPGPKVGAAALVAVLLASCGSDTTESTAATVLPGVDAATATYCQSSLDLETAIGAMDEPTPDALRTMQPQIDAFVAAAPTEVTAAAATFADTVAGVIAGGDVGALEGDDMNAARATQHTYDLANCGWQRVDVTLVDTSFQLTAPAAAGVYSFEGTNHGEQFHVIALGRLRDDAPEATAQEAWDAVMASPDGETEFGTHFDSVAGAGIAPGTDGYAVADLTPGSYVMFCPVSAGSDAAHDFHGDGPPHFMTGMLQFFTIA
jgi:hypothetical protein